MAHALTLSAAPAPEAAPWAVLHVDAEGLALRVLALLVLLVLTGLLVGG